MAGMRHIFLGAFLVSLCAFPLQASVGAPKPRSLWKQTLRAGGSSCIFCHSEFFYASRLRRRSCIVRFTFHFLLVHHCKIPASKTCKYCHLLGSTWKAPKRDETRLLHETPLLTWIAYEQGRPPMRAVDADDVQEVKKAERAEIGPCPDVQHCTDVCTHGESVKA